MKENLAVENSRVIRMSHNNPITVDFVINEENEIKLISNTNGKVKLENTVRDGIEVIRFSKV